MGGGASELQSMGCIGHDLATNYPPKAAEALGGVVQLVSDYSEFEILFYILINLCTTAVLVNSGSHTKAHSYGRLQQQSSRVLWF